MTTSPLCAAMACTSTRRCSIRAPSFGFDAPRLEDDDVRPMSRPLQGARRGIHDQRLLRAAIGELLEADDDVAIGPADSDTRHSSSACRRRARPRAPRCMRDAYLELGAPAGTSAD